MVASDSASRPLRTNSAHTKERILSTAESLFGQEGFAGTSIRDIAKAGRVNIGTIYHYFPNKRSLHSSILERAYAGLHTNVEKAAKADGAPKELLCQMVGAAADFLADHPMAHRVILQELLAGTEEMDSAIRLHLSKTRALLNEALQEGIRSGVFRPVNVEITSFGLMSALFGFFTSRSLFMKLFTEEDGFTLFSQNLPFPIFEMALDGLLCSPKTMVKRRSQRGNRDS